MSTTGLEVFDETVHKTNAWLKPPPRGAESPFRPRSK
jgi:hypothetical protein